MSKFTSIGLAAALIVGSATLASAQTYSGTEPVAPHAMRNHRASAVQPRAARRATEYGQPYGSQEPLSSSLDAGNTNGGN
jgi:hypothetical protein